VKGDLLFIDDLGVIIAGFARSRRCGQNRYASDDSRDGE